MSKIRKYKMSWKASGSKHVIGYKLYWSRGTSVSYDSNFINVGDTTKITFYPDYFLAEGCVMLGVAAIDKDGNESDITTLSEPHYFEIPKAPYGLSLKPMNEFKIADSSMIGAKQPKNGGSKSPISGKGDPPVTEANKPKRHGRKVRMKYYNDIGFRKRT